jgi:hypothetical protein
MEAVALDFTYRYAHPSGVVANREGKALQLATCGASHEQPHFFKGRIQHPRELGSMLVSLTEVVRAHYFLQRPALLDPVVTSNDEMLRFEGFSGCCGAYARVDLPASAFDGKMHGRGTTNVDFNEPMRAALTRMSDHEAFQLSVGSDHVTLEQDGAATIEKKVKLPVRWLKGFSEVQAYQPRLELVHEMPAAEARRFVRSLGSGNAPKRPSYVVQSGRALRLTQRETLGAVRIAGVHRLRSLQSLVGRAKAMRVWADHDAGTSGWELVLESGRFFLMVSPEIYRGFSGEGQVLETLAQEEWRRVLPQVRAQLKWQNQIDTAVLAAETGLDSKQIRRALEVLGARGLVGFDASAGRFFHRELPFDLTRVEKLQPRLENARKLLAEEKVRVAASIGEEAWDLDVDGTGVVHRVRIRPDGDKCSCPWFNKHRGERGPCKHVLAARLLLADNLAVDASVAQA